VEEAGAVGGPPQQPVRRADKELDPLGTLFDGTPRRGTQVRGRVTLIRRNVEPDRGVRSRSLLGFMVPCRIRTRERPLMVGADKPSCPYRDAM